MVLVFSLTLQSLAHVRGSQNTSMWISTFCGHGPSLWGGTVSRVGGAALKCGFS